MPVLVDNRCGAPPRVCHHLRRQGGRALRALGLRGAELSIALVDDPEMRTLNRRYRGVDRATDVLAFPQGEVRGPRMALLGDVVISLPAASRQARRLRRTRRAELDTLLVHGVLHLLGYDHVRSRAGARRMRAKTAEIEAAIRRETPRRGGGR